MLHSKFEKLYLTLALLFVLADISIVYLVAVLNLLELDIVVWAFFACLSSATFFVTLAFKCENYIEVKYYV